VKLTLQKLSPDNLKNYDGVVFVSTTAYGPLPLPDAPGFFKWLKAGHAFIGLHAASDIHGWPEYTDMIGGEFLHHGKQVGVVCLNQDPANPATASLPKAWTIQQEEIYQFTNYTPAKVHDCWYWTSIRRPERTGTLAFPGAKITAKEKCFTHHWDIAKT